MYWTLIFKSIFGRKTRLAMLILALALGSGTASALTGVTQNARQQITGELRSYGANLLILPAGRQGIEKALVSSIEKEVRKTRISGFLPQVYLSLKLRGKTIPAVGTSLAETKKINPYWDISENTPERNSESGVWIGKELAEKLQINPGDILELKGSTGKEAIKAAFFLESGGPEDHQIYIASEIAERLDGKQTLDLISVSVFGGEKEVRSLGKNLASKFPQIKSMPVKRVMRAETAVLNKIQALLLLMGLLVLIVSWLGSYIMMTTILLERQYEIGIKKAIGALEKTIRKELLGEALIIGILGGGLGWFFGVLFYRAAMSNILGNTQGLMYMMLPLAMLFSLIIAMGALFTSLKSTLKLQPTAILRGE